jgi:hypothetical protein
MTHSYIEAKKRIPSQRLKMVKMLKEAGEQGVTNVQFVNVGLGYGARLTELYQMGYEIDVDSLANGVYKYILRKEPGDIKSVMKAVEEIMMEIDRDYDGSITAKELESLLKSKNFRIVRRHGWFRKGGNQNA